VFPVIQRLHPDTDFRIFSIINGDEKDPYGEHRILLIMWKIFLGIWY